MALTRVNGNLISSGTITGNLFLSNTITGDKIASATIGSSNLTSTGVSSGSYGGTGNTVSITVDSQGRITAAANVASGGGSVAGSDTQVQYNNSSAFGAASSFTFNKSTTSPQLNVTGTTDSTLQLRATTATGGPYVGLSTNSNGAGVFWTWDTASVPLRFVAGGTEVARFAVGSGLPTTFQVANSISVGNVTPTSSGAGITFPATQSASSDANTLDDYEEGTWTPSIGGTATYNSQNGSYIKIGQLVYVHCYININVIGTGSTTVLSGLPFNVRASAADRNQAGSISYFNGLASSVVALFCQPISSSTTVNFPGLTAAGSSVVNPVTVFASSTQIYFSAVYQTNS